MRVQIANKEFEIKEEFVSTVSGFPFDKSDKYPHYHFKIKIRRTDRFRSGRFASFNFYGSYRDYQLGKAELEEIDLLSAFENILNDAIAGLIPYEDFLAEFGYEDDTNIRKIYKSCEKTLSKIKEMNLTEDDLCEITNELREKYNI